MSWGFYGRTSELKQLGEIFARGRWFFVKITGRRRIGKTTLIQQALPVPGRKVFYVQIPDSGPAGVLSAVADALETFQVDASTTPRPTSLREFAHTIGQLARAGYVVALDEFQYFSRERLREFCGEWHGRARDAEDAERELDIAFGLCDHHARMARRAAGIEWNESPAFDDDDGDDS